MAFVLLSEMKMERSRPNFGGAHRAPLTDATRARVVNPTVLKRTIYAVVYSNENGEEKCIWYRSRPEAEAATHRLQCPCQVAVVKL